MDSDPTVRMFKSLLLGYCPDFTTSYPKKGSDTNCIKVVCHPRLNHALQGKGAHLIICHDKRTHDATYVEASMNF